RDEFLAAQAAILIAVIRSPWDETRRGPELREWQRRRHEVLDPLCERAAALEKELFVGFAELAKINPSRTKDFVDKMSRLVVEAKHDGFMRRGKPYHKQPPALIEAELALRRALAAVKALTEREQYAIGAALFFRGWHDHRVREWVPVDSCDWVENLSDIALAACAAVGIGSQAPADPLSANHKD